MARNETTRDDQDTGNRAFSAKRDGNVENGIPVDAQGTVDERTRMGRAIADADEFSDDELRGFINSAPRTNNETIDRRTDEGRALFAAGMIDEGGKIISESPNRPNVDVGVPIRAGDATVHDVLSESTSTPNNEDRGQRESQTRGGSNPDGGEQGRRGRNSKR